MICDKQVDGNRGKDAVFEEIDSLLSRVQKEEEDANKLGLKKTRNFSVLISLFRFLIFSRELYINKILSFTAYIGHI